ncbi:MAG: lipopolysaccharide biosynthesis protein, partial [Dysgonamonadaceae bacterium]|nr:lipopolysaccharide biosynthesis protein [Dysgonamonadaceae bacterium]
FISSTIIVAITKYSSVIIGLIIIAVLSRLLTPDDFGIITIISVLAVFFNLIGELGIGVAIIQKKELTKGDINVIFSFTVVVGLMLAFLFFILAPLIASFYDKPVLVNICRLFSINIFCACCNIVPNGLILKDKNFKFLMFRQFIIQPISGALAIIAALAGWGVYALLMQLIAGSVLMFLTNYFRQPLKLVCIAAQPLKKIASYSLYQFLFGFVNYFARNLDKLLIGKYISPAALGYYEKSYRLMTLPIDTLTSVISPVIQPYFSDFQEDKERIYRYYLKIIHLLALIGFPLSVFLHFAAKELILIVFGEQWTAAIPIFEILAWSSGIQIILSSTGAIFQAANDTKRLFIAGVINALVLVGAICTGVFIYKSLNALAIVFVCALFFCFFQSYTTLIKITLKQSFIPFLKQLLLPLLFGLTVFILELAVVKWIEIDNLYMSLAVKMLVVTVIAPPVMLRYYRYKNNNK